MCQISVFLIRMLFGILFACLAVRDQKEKYVSLSSLGVMSLLSILMMLLRIMEAKQDDYSWILWDIGCGVLAGFFFLMISFISEEKIGYGDSLMILILGIGIGGWSLVCLLEVSAFLLILSIFRMWKKGKLNRKSEVAFFPYLFLGYLIYLLDGMINF